LLATPSVVAGSEDSDSSCRVPGPKLRDASRRDRSDQPVSGAPSKHSALEAAEKPTLQPPSGYRHRKLVQATARGRIDVTMRESDGREFLLKSYVEHDTERARSRAQVELEVLQRLAGPGVVHCVEVITDGDEIALLLEWVQGVPLFDWVGTSLPAVEAALSVGVQLAGVLARLHAARLVHRDLSPASALVDTTTQSIHLVDLESVRPLGVALRDAPPGLSSSSLADGLAYMAPEATGRMNRGIDERSDLYSLGAVLYLILTGQPPFETRDALGLVHAHLALVPAPPCELRTDTPPTLSRLVLKLLQKEPEDRYQTADGLLYDLERCLEQLRGSGSIANDLMLGSGDSPRCPLFAKTLYGRNAEKVALLDAYTCVQQGRSQLVLLSGSPGSGKSALVHELRGPVAKSGGYLAAGKFELYRRDAPYSGWIALLGSFADQLLIESEARLAQWRGELRTALQSIAGALVELVPSLGPILGQVPPVPKLGPRETQERLALAVARFVQAAATLEHPLVLFFDDLQWADPASSRLLEAIVERSQDERLLLVLAYREGEGEGEGEGASGHFSRVLARLAEAPVEVRRIALAPLDAQATAAMLADALGRSSAETERLAATILRKTGSVPLLVQQFVSQMHALGHIRFRPPHGWTWDDAQLEVASIPDGAVPFLVANLERLPPEPRELIQFASCVADEFDAELLAELSGQTGHELQPSLLALLEAGLIAPSAQGLRFAHDRIREAAQALLSDEQRARIHWETARHLLRTQSAEQREARAFEIADHVNRSGALVSAEYRLDAIACNRAAGLKALHAGAGAAAHSYFTAARNLLCESDWQEHRSQVFELMLHGAESAFLSSEFDEALVLLDRIEQPGLSSLEFGRIAVKRIQVYAMRDTVGESLPYTLSALARVGLRWPLAPSLPRLLVAIAATEWRLWQHRSKLAAGVAPEVDAHPERRRAPIEIIETSGAIMVRSSALLFALAVCWVVRCQLRYGSINSAGYGLAGYAAGIALNVQSARRAARLADVALAWDAQAPHPLFSGRVQLIVHGIIRPFVLPRREALHPLGAAIERMLELGDPEFAYYAINTQLILGMLGGDALEQAQTELRATEPIRRRVGYRDDETQCVLRAVDLLRTPDAECIDWHRAVGETEAWLIEHQGCNEPQVRTAWLLLFCVHGRYELGFDHSERIWAKLFRSAKTCRLCRAADGRISAAVYRPAPGLARHGSPGWATALDRGQGEHRRGAEHGQASLPPARSIRETTAFVDPRRSPGSASKPLAASASARLSSPGFRCSVYV